MFSETYFNVQFVAAVICPLLLAGCLTVFCIWEQATSENQAPAQLAVRHTSAWVFLFWPVSIHFVSPCSVPPTSPFVFGSNPFVRLPFLIESVGGCVFLDTKGVCFKPFLWFVLCFASFPACDLRPSGSVFCRNVTSFYNSKCKTLRVGQNIRLCAAALGSLQVVVLSVKCPWINKKSI